MTRRLDIAIAGCGPSGLASALFLTRAGHRVTLFEEFETPRPVGSGLMLQPSGLGVLETLGLRDKVFARGAPIGRIIGQSVPSNRIALDVSYDALHPGATALAVHRATLFDALYEAVGTSGADLVTGTRITGFAADRRLVDASGVRHGPFDLVVDATGHDTPLHAAAARPVSRRMLAYGALWTNVTMPDGGFGHDCLEQRYRAATQMAGLLPTGTGVSGTVPQAAFFWSLRQDELATWRANGLDAWKDKVRALWPEIEPVLNQIDDPDGLSFARYGHHTMRVPHGDGIVFIGDAAHATSPQLGQGANMGLLDAHALALGLAEHDGLADAMRAYAARRRLHVRLYQALSWVFTPFFQSESRLLPLVRDLAVGPVGRVAVFRHLLARTVSGTLCRTGTTPAST